MQPAILTGFGKWIDFDDTDVREIDIDDIYSALSRIRRYTGHSLFSVADHSCLVADLVEEARPGDHRAIIRALLHDAHEAYTGDISSPMKEALGREAKERIAEIQLRLDEAIFRSLGIEDSMKLSADRMRIVKICDDFATRIERNYFLPNSPRWPKMYIPLSQKIAINMHEAKMMLGSYPGKSWRVRLQEALVAIAASLEKKPDAA